MKKTVGFFLAILIFFGHSPLIFAIEEAADLKAKKSNLAEGEAAASDENYSGEAETVRPEGMGKGTEKNEESIKSLNGVPMSDIFNTDTFYAKIEKGVLQRNGEVSVHEQNGALLYHYALNLPPARGNFSPQLTISYNSQSGEIENIIGHKWEITTNKIIHAGRGTDFQYDERRFHLYLNGLFQEMVQAEERDGKYGVYRDKYGGQSFKAVFNSNNIWEVWDTKGTKYEFRTGMRGYEWHLSKVTDVDENVVEYQYTIQGGQYFLAGGDNMRQIYPQKIIYNDGKVKINFVYQERSDVLFDGKRGFLVQTAYRLSKVEVKVLEILRRRYQFVYEVGDNGHRELLQSILETGWDENGNEESYPETGFEYQASGARGWEFQSSGFSFPEEIVTGYSNYDRGMVDMGVRLMDMNGDGTQDLIQGGSSYCDNKGKIYLHNQESGWETTEDIFPRDLVYISSEDLYRPAFNESLPARIVDINGDGLGDYVRSNSQESQSIAYRVWQDVQINQGNNVWTQSAIEFPELLSHYSRYGQIDKGVLLADINGDGLVDIVRGHSGCVPYDEGEPCGSGSNYRKRVYINNGNGWDRAPDWENNMPDVYFSHVLCNGNAECEVKDSGARLTDANGDGLVDIIMWPDDSRWIGEVYLNTGKGWVNIPDRDWNFPARMWMYKNKYSCYYSGDVDIDQGYRFIDVNGDGLTDLLKGCGGGYEYCDGNNGVYLNMGNGWEYQEGWGDIPTVAHVRQTAGGDCDFLVEFGSHHFADINNDGMIDYFRRIEMDNRYGWNNPDIEKPKVFLNKGGVPDLLKKIKNNLGGEVEIKYQLSSRYPQAFNQATGARVNVNLMTVSEIVYKDQPADSRSWQTITYDYQDGYYYFQNPQEKEFAGFGVVERRDADGNKIISYYHQGNGNNTAKGEQDDDIKKKGRIYRVERIDGNNNLRQATIRKWEKTPLVSVEAGKRNFIKLRRETDISYDQQGNGKAGVISYTYDDETGAIIQEREYGEALVNDLTGELIENLHNDDLIIVKTYAQNSELNLYNYPAEELLKDETGKIWSKKQYYYDDQAPGQVIKGHLTKKCRVL